MKWGNKMSFAPDEGHPNAKYISGEWYEEQYGNHETRYHNMYVQAGISVQAKEMNNYWADLFSLLLGLGKDARVLELGTGVGYYMESWLRKGCDVQGIEISKNAIRVSKHRHRIVHGSIADMSMFKNEEFDLVTSLALLEHIDESILDKAISEMFRVGIRQAHVMSSEKGNDESHITLMEEKEWLIRFAEVAKDGPDKRMTIFNVPDYLMNLHAKNGCILLGTSWDLLSQVTKVWVHESREMMEKNEPLEGGVV